jgi:peptide methionine sulfoxide reductase MsrA
MIEAFWLAKLSKIRITEEEAEDFIHACEYHQRMKQQEKKQEGEPCSS